MADRPKSLRIPDALWQEFTEAVKQNPLYKDNSDCIRGLMRNFIQEKRKSLKK